MSARDFNALVLEVARRKRRMDRIGGLLLAAEEAYQLSVGELDRAIVEECKPITAPVAHQPSPLRFGRGIEAVVPPPAPSLEALSTGVHTAFAGEQWLAQVRERAAERKTRRSPTCSHCRRQGHNRFRCPDRRKQEVIS